MVWWIWVVIAVVFGIVEVTNMALYALFVAAGALAAGLASALGLGWLIELIAFGGVSLGGIAVLRRPLKHVIGPRTQGALVSGAPGLVGRSGKVVKRVEGPHTPGAVYVHGEEWPAITYDAEALEPDRIVVVVELDRTNLVVTSE